LNIIDGSETLIYIEWRLLEDSRTATNSGMVIRRNWVDVNSLFSIEKIIKQQRLI